MKTKHTSGKIKAHGNYLGCIDEDGNNIPEHITHVVGAESRDQDEVNAIRIEKCWNYHDEMLAELKTSHDFLLSMIRGFDDYCTVDKVAAMSNFMERMQKQREIIESVTK